VFCAAQPPSPTLDAGAEFFEMRLCSKPSE
jgi:hypothetical protein